LNIVFKSLTVKISLNKIKKLLNLKKLKSRS
jgi:hypothetical protein